MELSAEQGLRDESRQSLRPRKLWVSLGLLALLVLLFFAPVLAGVRTFPDGDFTHHFLPFSQAMAQAWRATMAPLWNVYTYSGHPYWADVQAAVLYPVSNLVLLATLPLRSAGARFYILQLEAIAHVLLAGWFTYLLARQLTERWLPPLLAAIAFMLSGYVTGYPPLQLAVLRTAVWLPLLLWLLLRAWQEPGRWRYWIGAALVLATSFVAGHSQTFLYIAYAAAGWVATLAIAVRGSALAKTLGLAAAGVLAAGLASAQLLPSVEFARLSVRADVDYAFLSGGFPLQDTWQLLLPGVLTHFSPLYVGVVALGLALFGIVSAGAGGRQSEAAAATNNATAALRRAAVVYFTVLPVLGLLAAYGDNGFLYASLYRFAPGWDLFRGQERAAYVVAFGLSMLAAFGLAHAALASLRSRRRFALTYGVLVIAGVYVFGLFWQLPEHTAIGPWQYLAIAALTLLLAMTTAVTLWLEGWSVRREWLICGLAAANLMLANMTTNLANRTPDEAVALPPEVVALQEAVRGERDATGLDGRAYNEFRVYEDYGMAAGVEDVWGSSPLRLSAYAALFDEFPLDRMFRLTGVRHVLTWRKDLFEASERLAEFPQAEDVTYLHRLQEANPRLWIADEVVVADDDVAVELLADHEFDLDRKVVLPAAQGVQGWSGEADSATIQAARPRAHQLDISVDNSGGGVLVVSENWMPGWRVRDARCEQDAPCDRSEAHPIGLPALTPVRANLAFLAVALPEGDVRFSLVYAPDSVRLGLIISGATLLLIAVAATVRFVARPAGRHGRPAKA